MLKRTRSFDWLLVAIFVTNALLQTVQVWDGGFPLHIVTVTVSLVVVRFIIRANSLQEAVVWVSARPRLAFMLIFIWLTSFVQVGWAVLFGQFHVVEAVGLYLVAMVVFSTVIMLGYLLVSFVGRLLASLW